MGDPYDYAANEQLGVGLCYIPIAFVGNTIIGMVTKASPFRKLQHKS
jgi:hypothetical protein